MYRKWVPLFALALGLASSSASASLMHPRAVPALDNNRMNVKIVCEQNGFCYHRGRRPVVRWVYGEKAFHGPYVGPGYYGWPGSHHGWWPFVGY